MNKKTKPLNAKLSLRLESQDLATMREAIEVFNSNDLNLKLDTNGFLRMAINMLSKKILDGSLTIAFK